jgi:hypothetical protein
MSGASQRPVNTLMVRHSVVVVVVVVVVVYVTLEYKGM